MIDHFLVKESMIFQWGRKQTKRQVASERPRTLIDIPNEGIKGKLIGRDGCIIRAIKENFDVCLIIDDTKAVVFLEGENNVALVKGLILEMIQSNDFSMSILSKYKSIRKNGPH